MENKQNNEKLQDEGRLAYMIEWRDRHIKALEEMIAEMESANTIYAAYITFLLEKCYGLTDCIRISKQSIRNVCGKYRVNAEDAGEDFIIWLTETGDAHGTQSNQMADA